MRLFNGCLWRWASEAGRLAQCQRAANALRMMKAERLSGDRATSAAPGDAEVMGKVGSAPLWPRISRRRAGRRRTDPTLEGRRKPLSFMKRECTYLKRKSPGARKGSWLSKDWNIYWEIALVSKYWKKYMEYFCKALCAGMLVQNNVGVQIAGDGVRALIFAGRSR